MTQFSPPVWLEEFRRARGRNPRVLHIGNIANNAYINAKILNENGIESHVLCNDYFHIMGYPEWEDADFTGKLSELHPDWKSVDLGGYRRPAWFAQGHLSDCLRYLRALQTGGAIRRRFYGSVLAEQSGVPYEAGFVTGLLLSLHRFVQPLGRRGTRWILAAGQRDTLSRLERKLQNSRFLRSFPGFSTISVAVAIPILCAVVCTRILLGLSVLMIPGLRARKKPGSTRLDELVQAFAAHFPERADALGADDVAMSLIYPLRRVFAYYDVIHAYGTSPELALLAGSKPYVAYEHGTIRDIPFQSDRVGRLTALSYAMANCLYLTNADSIPAAARLRGEGLRGVVFGLHGFDERRLAERSTAANKGLRFRLGVSGGQKMFLAPARQHWRTGYATWRKGNDQIIHAVKRLAERGRADFRVIFARWGSEVADSEELIRSLGLEEFFLWIPPLAKAELIAAYREADGILDQFVLPCIGAVSLEALAVGGGPLITALDQDVIRRFYGEEIPAYNCRNEKQIAEAMAQILDEPALARARVAACRDWMARYHSHQTVLVKAWEAYEICLAGAERIYGSSPRS